MKEVKAPLTSSLMFLERLLESCPEQAQRSLILLIISQVNFLLCTVNDYLDLGQIQRDLYMPESKIFDPTSTLKYIVSVFK